MADFIPMQTYLQKMHTLTMPDKSSENNLTKKGDWLEAGTKLEQGEPCNKSRTSIDFDAKSL